MTHEKRRAELDNAVSRRQAHREIWRKEGERSLGQNLALAGTLGWLVVVPSLLGTLFGRWLDAKLGTGVTFTSALMCVGLVTGCWLAWQKVRSA